MTAAHRFIPILRAFDRLKIRIKGLNMRDRTILAIRAFGLVACVLFLISGRPPAHAQDSLTTIQTQTSLIENRDSISALQATVKEQAGIISALDTSSRQYGENLAALNARWEMFMGIIGLLNGASIYVSVRKVKA